MTSPHYFAVGLGELGRSPTKARVQRRPPNLSPSEAELATLAAYADPAGEGTVKDTAHRLGWSENTVKARLKRLYAKLDVRNAAQAVVELQRRERAA